MDEERRRRDGFVACRPGDPVPRDQERGMTSTPSTPHDIAEKVPSRRAEDPRLRFDVAELPPEIAEAALGSGNFPYARKLDAKTYRSELGKLQIELVKMLDWIKRERERVVVVFEGRDTAGKGGVIQRLTEHLNPRFARIVALPRPTETELGQWYFQRYVAHLPPRGEIAIFDRSWYNRATVEPVYGFCTAGDTAVFLREAPVFEAMLARDGIRIVKFFLSIGREMQIARLHARWHDPLRRWKLSDIDFTAIEKWDAYSAAFEAMLIATDSAAAPWTVALANDKHRVRLETIRHLLGVMPYAHKDQDALGRPDPRILLSAATFLGTGGEAEG
jgi:polyphosphate kinase 2